METGYSKWRKLDNAALAFPLVTDKNDTRVFRFYCQLKEGTVSVKVLKSEDQWFGVTYKEDRETVVEAVKSLIDKGIYPDKL